MSLICWTARPDLCLPACRASQLAILLSPHRLPWCHVPLCAFIGLRSAPATKLRRPQGPLSDQCAGGLRPAPSAERPCPAPGAPAFPDSGWSAFGGCPHRPLAEPQRPLPPLLARPGPSGRRARGRPWAAGPLRRWSYASVGARGVGRPGTGLRSAAWQRRGRGLRACRRRPRGSRPSTCCGPAPRAPNSARCRPAWPSGPRAPCAVMNTHAPAQTHHLPRLLAQASTRGVRPARTRACPRGRPCPGGPAAR